MNLWFKLIGESSMGEGGDRGREKESQIHKGDPRPA